MDGGSYEALELPELCAELRRRGLVSSGARTELVQRLQDHDRLASRRGTKRPGEDTERCLAARRLLDEACLELGQEAEALLSEAFAADDAQAGSGAPLSPDDDSDLLGLLVPEGGDEYDEACPVAGSDEYFLAAEDLDEAYEEAEDEAEEGLAAAAADDALVEEAAGASADVDEASGVDGQRASAAAAGCTASVSSAPSSAALLPAQAVVASASGEAAYASAGLDAACLGGDEGASAAPLACVAASASSSSSSSASAAAAPAAGAGMLGASREAARAGAGAGACGEGGERQAAPNPLAMAWLRRCAMMGAMEAAPVAAAAGADAGGAAAGCAMAGGLLAAWMRAFGAAREASAEAAGEVSTSAPGGERAPTAAVVPTAYNAEREARATSAPAAGAPSEAAAACVAAAAAATAAHAAAEEEPAVVELTPRLQCLRDLARRSCAELGVPYSSLIDKLRGQAKAADLSGRIPSFRVRDRIVLPPLKAARPVQLHRPAVASKAAPPSISGVVVVVDEDPEPEPRAEASEAARKEDSGAARAPAGADAGAGGAAEEAADPYASRTAPLVLLRTYLSQDRWVGMRQGLLVFEDDGVQYPAATLAPVWEQPSGGSLLNLASLWLLGSLRERYEAHAKPNLLRRHGAARVASSLAPSLLEFMLGRKSSCELLVAQDRLYAVPVPSPLRLARPNTAAPGARPPLAPSDLCSLPGESSLLEKGELLQQQRAAEGLERLRQQVAEKSEGKGEADGLQLVEGLQAVSKVQMSLRRLEMEEKALTKLREELQARLHAADRRLLKASKRRQQLHEEYRAQLSALHAAAKRRRLAAGGSAAGSAAGGRRGGAQPATGGASDDQLSQKAPATEELIAQLLTALEAGAVRAPKQCEPPQTLE